MTSEQLFQVRFNFQNMLRQQIHPYDYERIANILDITPEDAKTAMESFDFANAQAAREIAAGSDPEKWRDKKARIVFLGDSITSDRMSYLNILKKVFQRCGGIELMDSSVSGWRSGDVLQELYGSVLSKEADMVVFALGTNDIRRIYGRCNVTSRKEFARNMDLIFDALKGRQLIANTIPPFHTERIQNAYGTLGWSFESGDLKTCNRILQKAACKHSVILNDMRQEFQNAVRGGLDVFHEDGLHLNGEGQKMIAQSVYAVLQEHLK